MQPNQPTIPPASAPPEYDFILNPEAPRKKAMSAGLGKRLLVVSGGFLVLIIAFMVISSLLSGGGGNADNLLTVAQDQTEIIRVSDLAYTMADSTASKNLAVTTSSTTKTALNSVEKLLVQLKKTPSTSSLALKKDVKTDAQLTTASQSNQFDSVFNSILIGQLRTYQADAKKVYDSASGKTEKQVMADVYNGVSVIIKANSN